MDRQDQRRTKASRLRAGERGHGVGKQRGEQGPSYDTENDADVEVDQCISARTRYCIVQAVQA